MRGISSGDYAYFALTVSLGVIVARGGQSWFVVAIFIASLYFSAEIIYKALVNKGVNEFKYWFNQSLKEGESENYPKQIEYLDKALKACPDAKENPHVVNALVVRGRTKVLLNDFRGGITDLSNAIDIDPNSGDIFNLRSTAKHLWIVSGSEDAPDYYDYTADVRRAAELGVEDAVSRTLLLDKKGIEMWTNHILENAFEFSPSTTTYNQWGYVEDDDINSDEWHIKFLDVAALTFCSLKSEPDDVLADLPFAPLYADFMIWILELKCVDSLTLLKKISPRIEIDVYDRLLFRLTKTSNLTGKLSEYFNTRFCDLYRKQPENGLGLEVLS